MLDCIVIGAGQAGLAAAYYLDRAGCDYLVVEADGRIGDVWRRRWAGLRLFTPNRYNALPGAPFPGRPYGRPLASDVGDYLEAYAEREALAVRTGAPAQAVTRYRGGLRVDLTDGALTARHVVVAAGAYRTPRVPGFADRLPADLPTIHSSELRDPDGWLPKDRQHVLVVGTGASGFQLARRLNVRHRLTLAGPDPGRLPRRFLGRDVYDYLYGFGVISARVDTLAGKFFAGTPRGGEVRVGEAVDAVARREGIARCGKVMDYDGDFLLDEGGVISEVDAVVFATGYDNRYPFLSNLPGALRPDHQPLHRLGRSPVPGLWWLGLRHLRRVNSSLLGGVGRDAEELVGEIVGGS